MTKSKIQKWLLIGILLVSFLTIYLVYNIYYWLQPPKFDYSNNYSVECRVVSKGDSYLSNTVSYIHFNGKRFKGTTYESFVKGKMTYPCMEFKPSYDYIIFKGTFNMTENGFKIEKVDSCSIESKNIMDIIEIILRDRNNKNIKCQKAANEIDLLFPESSKSDGMIFLETLLSLKAIPINIQTIHVPGRLLYHVPGKHQYSHKQIMYTCKIQEFMVKQPHEGWGYLKIMHCYHKNTPVYSYYYTPWGFKECKMINPYIVFIDMGEVLITK